MLDALVPGPARLSEMHALVDQLGADGFKERQTATVKLMNTPLVPPEILKRGLTSKDPDVRIRARMVERRAGNRAEEVFARALDLVATRGETGHLERILKVLESGVPCTQPDDLERAAAITAVEGDADILAKEIENDSELVRRLVAAAAERIGKPGMEMAKRLLKNERPAVRLRAAITLGNLGELAGARALGEFLGSADTIERVRAWKALTGLTGKDFAYRPLEQPAKRKASTAAWREWLASEALELTGRAEEPKWTRLFNGRDLSGWEPYRSGKAIAAATSGWKVADGVLTCPGRGPGDLRTKNAFDQYILVVRFRAPERNSDSGIGLMLASEKAAPNARGDVGEYLEVQLLPNRSGDLYVIGGFKADADGERIRFSHRRRAEAGDKAGVWHEARMEVADGSAAVYINGIEVNRATGGPRQPGKILLREERFPFEFQEISLLELEDAF